MLKEDFIHSMPPMFQVEMIFNALYPRFYELSCTKSLLYGRINNKILFGILGNLHFSKIKQNFNNLEKIHI